MSAVIFAILDDFQTHYTQYLICFYVYYIIIVLTLVCVYMNNVFVL